MSSYSHFFSKNISIYAIFNDQSFNDTLTNDIVSFEQLGPDCFIQIFDTKSQIEWETVQIQILQSDYFGYCMHLLEFLPFYTGEIIFVTYYLLCCTPGLFSTEVVSKRKEFQPNSF